nr:FG-GAP repeat protein [Microbulbifer rhizosphaerae]
MFVTGFLAEAVGYFKASNTEAGDGFGNQVALSADGRVMAVGAVWEDSAAGAVYVFTNSDGVWSQQAYIKASNAEEGDEFGTSLTLSSDGSVLAVSALREGSGATGVDGDQADNSASRAGAVYVFTQSGDTWAQQAYIKASNTEEGDYFGEGLALSPDGTTLAVGAPFENSGAIGIDGHQTNSLATAAGAVYVFTQSGDTWAQQAYIKASNTESVEQFGKKIALSSDGSLLAVSAPQEDSSATGIGGDQADNAAENSGAVYMFTRSGGAWAQQAYIKASNTGKGDQFGSSLVLSADGGVLAVGARGEDSSAGGIDGDQADNSANASGAVYVFTQSGDTWFQQAYIKASNVENIDVFGLNLALSADGATLAVGATGEDSSATGINGDQADNSAGGSGAVYLFTQSAGVWSLKSYIKASNAEADDQFGTNLALSSDGGILAVGATWEDSSATGINGDQADNSAEGSGAVYLY